MPDVRVSAVGIGWLQGTIHGDLADWAASMALVFGEWRPGPANGFYEVGHRFGEHGAALAERPRVSAAGRADELLVSVPQSALDAADKAMLREFVDALLCAGFRPSRTDLYVDVTGADRLTPYMCGEWTGAILSRTDSRSFTVSRKRVLVPTGGGQVERRMVQGATFTRGTRESSAYLRVYDKAAEALMNRGEVIEPTTRVELEAHRDKEFNLARDLLEAWMLAESELIGPKFLSFVLRVLDFRDCAADHPHKVRYARPAWWEAFVGQVERATVCRVVAVRTVQKTVRWVGGQVLPALLGLSEAYDRCYPHLPRGSFARYLAGWIESARPRYSFGQLRLLVERVEAGFDLFPSLSQPMVPLLGAAA